MLAACRTTLTAVGAMAWSQWRALRYLAAVVACVLLAGLKPRHWPRTVREVFTRQLLFTGVEACRFVVFVAILAGITVVVETYLWLERVGLSQQIGPLLVMLVARELGPLFVNIIVIVRSGSAMASELGVMRVAGEVRALEAQGIDPFLYLLMPRVAAMTLATFCLTALFNVVAFASGFGFGYLLGVTSESPGMFLNAVFASIEPSDVLSILAKSTLPPILTSVICSTEGLNAGTSVTRIPAAGKHALSRSVGALFITFVAISLLTYG